MSTSPGLRELLHSPIETPSSWELTLPTLTHVLHLKPIKILPFGLSICRVNNVLQTLVRSRPESTPLPAIPGDQTCKCSQWVTYLKHSERNKILVVSCCCCELYTKQLKTKQNVSSMLCNAHNSHFPASRHISHRKKDNKMIKISPLYS